MKRLSSVVAGLSLLAVVATGGLRAATDTADAPFADWAAVVVAADWRASTGNETRAFDNARRDVSLALARIGFEDDAIRQYSARPDWFADETQLSEARLEALDQGLGDLAARHSSGCLVYLTSHGERAGIVMGENLVSPAELDAVLVRHCPESRPTVLIVSACFSGVFALDEMMHENRMIFTAARRDRSSFGCGETDTYPYFDDCFLGALARSDDLIETAERTMGCVSRREKREQLTPSLPQLRVGERVRPVLESAIFPKGETGF